VPSASTVDVYNADGSVRTQKSIVNGVTSFTSATMTIPSYQLIFPGGDLRTYGNAEYRIPLVGPVTLAIFLDAGIDKITRPGQLAVTESRIAQLNGETGLSQAGFTNRAIIAGGTQAPRMSTGLELQVLMPVVNAPFRVYYAYNPMVVHEYLQPPVVADRSIFPNEATFLNALAAVGQTVPFLEPRHTFRFTIGRTF